MNADIIKRMNAARERGVDLGGGKRITLRRPTQLDLARAVSDGQIKFDRDKVLTHVVDWGGFTEADMYPGGPSDAITFDADLWALWIADHPEHWTAVGNSLIEMIRDYNAQTESSEKN